MFSLSHRGRKRKSCFSTLIVAYVWCKTDTRGRSFCAENTGENDIIWMVMIMARTARKKWTTSHRGSSIRLPAINYASSLAQRSWKTLQRSSQRSPGNTSRSWRMRACQSVKSAAWQESSSGSYANCKHKRTVPLCLLRGFRSFLARASSWWRNHSVGKRISQILRSSGISWNEWIACNQF